VVGQLQAVAVELAHADLADAGRHVEACRRRRLVSTGEAPPRRGCANASRRSIVGAPAFSSPPASQQQQSPSMIQTPRTQRGGSDGGSTTIPTLRRLARWRQRGSPSVQTTRTQIERKWEATAARWKRKRSRPHPPESHQCVQGDAPNHPTERQWQDPASQRPSSAQAPTQQPTPPLVGAPAFSSPPADQQQQQQEAHAALHAWQRQQQQRQPWKQGIPRPRLPKRKAFQLRPSYGPKTRFSTSPRAI
jgi:hypothetical protein